MPSLRRTPAVTLGCQQDGKVCLGRVHLPPTDTIISRGFPRAQHLLSGTLQEAWSSRGFLCPDGAGLGRVKSYLPNCMWASESTTRTDFHCSFTVFGLSKQSQTPVAGAAPSLLQGTAVPYHHLGVVDRMVKGETGTDFHPF